MLLHGNGSYVNLTACCRHVAYPPSAVSIGADLVKNIGGAPLSTAYSSRPKVLAREWGSWGGAGIN